MTDLENLKQIAETLQCADKFKGAFRIAHRLADDEHVCVVVTGMRSSGKTTLINRMIGSEIREPGNMDDHELPLRVSFEPMEPEEGCQCEVAANHEWCAKDAVLYEFREENIIQGGVLKETAYLADFCLFLISANAPFNINEVKLLKKMKDLNCRVVANGIEFIKAADRQKVIDYIEKINSSLELPPVLVLDGNAEQDIGRMIRNELPAYHDQKESRIKRQMLVENYIREALISIIQEKITENNEQMNEAQVSADQEIAYKRNKANCYTLRTDIEDYRKKAVQSVTSDLYGQTDTLVSSVMKKYSEEKKESAIQQHLEILYKNAAYEAVDKLRENYLSDLKKVHGDASLLAIPGWDEDLYKKLCKYAPGCDCSTIEPPNPGTRTVDAKPPVADSTKILIGTGAAVGVFVLAPFPTAVSVVGSIAAIGVGGSTYVKKRQAEKNAEISAALQKALKEGLRNIEDLLRDVSKSAYSSIIDALKECEEEMSLPEADLSSYQKESERLNDLLIKCRGQQ